MCVCLWTWSRLYDGLGVPVDMEPEVHNGCLSLPLSTFSFSSFVWGFPVCLFEIRSYYVDKAGLELLVILLPQPHEYWDYKCKLSVKSLYGIFIVGKQVLFVCLVMLGIKLRTSCMRGKAPFCVPPLTAYIVKYTLLRIVPNI